MVFFKTKQNIPLNNITLDQDDLNRRRCGPTIIKKYEKITKKNENMYWARKAIVGEFTGIIIFSAIMIPQTDNNQTDNNNEYILK